VPLDVDGCRIQARTESPAPAAAETAPLTLDVSKGRYEIELESATRLVSTLPGISCHG